MIPVHRHLVARCIQLQSKVSCLCFHTSTASHLSKKKPNQGQGDSLTLLGNSYNADSLTNISASIASKTGRNLHNTPGHPLYLIYKRMESFFHHTYVQRGNPIFSAISTLSPVVTHEQNFDSLLVAKDHISRSPADTYYVNSEHMLRSHTSAHQRDLIRSGLDAFVVAGDVYRRDTIDGTHYPVFHQMDGVRLYSSHQLFSKVQDESAFKLFESGHRDTNKQETHTMETSKLLEHDLKQCLEGLMRYLFGQDLDMKWVDAYFPFTHPSWELEIFHGGDWVEMLGCGIMEQKLVDSAGPSSKAGWAFGLGLERLAMKLYSIPDIRLFWSQDSGFLKQFEGKDINDNITYKEISKYPQCMNNVSFWISADYSSMDFYDLVRTVGGDVVEQVELIDEFTHPKTGKCSHCYRIVYRHMERTLTQAEANDIHKQIEQSATAELGVQIR